MTGGNRNLGLSGERFTVTYMISAKKEEAEAVAEHICIEQTVEFPYDLIGEGDIKEHITGTVESFKETGNNIFSAEISYAVEVTGDEFPQFLNNVFGNISILPDIRITDISIPVSMNSFIKGPRFGTEGIKRIFQADERPLVCSALKPLGLGSRELAEQSYEFAKGGIDIIKDDHGITNQKFSPFRERVKRCSDAVREANSRFGTKTLYMPNITGPADKIFQWAGYAKEAGAGGVLISPVLSGFDVMRKLSADNSFGLPIMAHPAFSGTYVHSRTSGISHGVMYGILMRLAGADMTVFPNYGGRFSFSEEQCREITAGCTKKMPGIKPILPAPGGGMTISKIPELKEFYGKDFVMLVGGDLHRVNGSLSENTRNFRTMIENSPT